MKLIFAIMVALAFAACTTPHRYKESDVPPVVTFDGRTEIVDALSFKWIRQPDPSRGISDNDPIAAQCNEPGWSYIFFDDNAVIGYEPFPDAVSVMHAAVALTVESHNLEYPSQEWDYINVSIPIDPPITSSDPILDAWQYALCLDNGTIVEGPYTAEFEFNWDAFKASGAALQLEFYNRDHDPDAHIVWGPDK